MECHYKDIYIYIYIYWYKKHNEDDASIKQLPVMENLPVCWSATDGIAISVEMNPWHHHH